MSLVMISELGGRWVSSNDVTVNVPHVVGNSEESIHELIDGLGKLSQSLRGNGE